MINAHFTCKTGCGGLCLKIAASVSSTSLPLSRGKPKDPKSRIIALKLAPFDSVSPQLIEEGER